MRTTDFREILSLDGLAVGFTVKNTSGSGININPEVKLSGYTILGWKNKYVFEVDQEEQYVPPYGLYVPPGEERHFSTKKKYGKEFPFLWFKVYEVNGKKFRLLHTDSDVVGFFQFYWHNEIERDEIMVRLFCKVRCKIEGVKEFCEDIKMFIRQLKRNWKRSLSKWRERCRREEK